MKAGPGSSSARVFKLVSSIVWVEQGPPLRAIDPADERLKPISDQQERAATEPIMSAEGNSPCSTLFLVPVHIPSDYL